MAEPAASRAPRAEPVPDPVAEARALVTMAIGLGTRLRTARQQGVVTQRKAALYVSTLVRHAARLLQGTESHGIPILRANDGSPSRRVTHWVIRSDRIDGPPAATRLLVLGSDGRLRCCVIGSNGGARIWADYDLSTAPEDLSQRVVMQALSALIGQLERTVTDLEIRQITRDAELEADIAMSKARIAGLVDQPTTPVGTRGPAVSEEPVRPWTRHGATAARLLAQRPTQAARPAAGSGELGAAPRTTGPGANEEAPAAHEEATVAAAPAARDEVPVVAAPAARNEAPTPVTVDAAAAPDESPARVSLLFRRLGNSI